jgi:FkbM family methyltransferase
MLSAGKPDVGDRISFTHRKRTFHVPRPASADYIIGQIERRGSFYERQLLVALAARVGQGTVALDCGANIGNHALFFAGVMGLSVHAFEPVARNANLLAQTVAMNGLGDRVRIVPTALSDRVAVVAMSTPDAGNPGMFRISASGEGVMTDTLDGYMLAQRIDPAALALIKIDVEGHEAQVLRGGRATLQQTGAIVTAEMATLVEYDAILEVLAPCGYHPTGVFCTTPTVMFEKGDAAFADVRPVIAAYQAKTDRRGA